MSDINELTWPDVMSISFASIEDRKQFEKLFSGWKSATEDAVKRERTAVEAEIANLKAQVKALREALRKVSSLNHIGHIAKHFEDCENVACRTARAALDAGESRKEPRR